MSKKSDQRELDSSLKLIVKTSFIVFIGLILSKIFTYSYKIIIARYYGPEVYGVFSLALMIFGVFAAFFSFGLAEGLLRYISLYRTKNNNTKVNFLVRKTLYVLLFSSILATVLLFLLSNSISIRLFHNSELSFYLKIFSLVLPFWIFSTIFLSIIRANERISAYSFIFNIVQNLSKLLIIALLLFIGLRSSAVIFSFVIGTIIVFLVALYYCRKNFPNLLKKSEIKKSQERLLFKNLFSYSWAIMFLGIISSLFYWIDSFSIGYFKGVIEVGFYNAVIPIAALLTLSSEIFIQLFFPLVTKLYSRKKFSLINDISKQVEKWILIINLPILYLLILFPGVFINLLFGKEYLIAESALRFLSIAALFSSLFSISNNLLFMIGKSKLILSDMISASILNLTLNFILIPIPTILFIDNSMGIAGAAIATMISTAFFNILLMFQIRYYLKIVPFNRNMIKIFLITIFLITPSYILSMIINVKLFILFIIVILFGISYLTLIIITKCLDKNDFMILKAIWKKIFGK